MKNLLQVILASSIVTFQLYGQSFLNGSFENTTSPGSCNYNITNAAYSSLMSNSEAFGVYEAIDIQVSGCYVPTIPDGTYAVALANNPLNNLEGEAISLELSAPLTTGSTYDISFKTYAMPDFNSAQGDLLIGASTDGISFGTQVFVAPTVISTWTTTSVSFTAPNNATHITIMPVAGVSSWNSIDDFTISPACFVTGTDTQVACDSLTWIDSNTYYADNNVATYTLVGAGVGGCDSIVTLDLTINTVDATVATNDPSIMANAVGASYQWLDCENNYSLIVGEISQLFNPIANGIYAVQVTENGCTDTSACVSIVTIGVGEYELLSETYIYPNPTTGLVNVHFGLIDNASLKVYDIMGKEVYNRTTVQAKELQFNLNALPGMYFVEIASEGEKREFKLIIH